MHEFHTYAQRSQYDSPWSAPERIRLLLWQYAWPLFCQWTPKPLNGWRLFWLRLFGATIHGEPFVHSRARIQMPWKLTLHDRACLGDRANAYTLGEIEIKQGATIAQEVYLCTGTHDFAHPMLLLQTAKITIEEDVFIGARAFVMPGVTVGRGSIVGACSVVTRDLPAHVVGAGNPCLVLRSRRPAQEVDASFKPAASLPASS